MSWLKDAGNWVYKNVIKPVGKGADKVLDWVANSFIGDVYSGLPIVGDMISSYRGREQQGYNRDLTANIMDREDTAISRAAADMEAAGINPLLAVGSPATSGGMSASEPARSGGDQYLEALKTKAYLKQSDAQAKMFRSRAGTFDAQSEFYKGENRRSDAFFKDELNLMQIEADWKRAQISSSQVSDELNRQNAELARYNVSLAEIDRMHQLIRFAFMQGEDVVNFKLQGQQYRLDLTSMRYPGKVELEDDLLRLAINQIAREHAGHSRDVAGVQATWATVNQLAALLQGGMTVVGPTVKQKGR